MSVMPPPRDYPHFKKMPRSLSEKLEISFANSLMRAFAKTLERFDYADGPLVESVKKRVRRKMWQTRNDYLFMLAFATFSVYDGIALVHTTIRYGGYVIIIFVLVTMTIYTVLMYFIVFITVYTKKSVLNFGQMVPIFTGFGYLVLLLCSAVVVTKMRLFMYFAMFAFEILAHKYNTCEGLNEEFVHSYNKCINVLDPAEVKKSALGPSCEVLNDPILLIRCGKEIYMLSTTTVINKLYVNLQPKYIAMILSFIAYGVIVFILSRTQIPGLIKVLRGVLLMFICCNIFVICSSFFIGGVSGLSSIFSQMNQWPSRKVLYLGIVLALPKITEMLVLISATTARLPLCTAPAMDCIILSGTRVCASLLFAVANVVMASALKDATSISLPSVNSDLAPFTTATYFLTFLPFSGGFWAFTFFVIYAMLIFARLLAVVEAISANVIWQSGYNKPILFILHAFAGICVLYFYFAPNPEDKIGWAILFFAVNFPLLTAFVVALFVYGVNKLEEDIAFMTASPPADLMTRLLKVFPVISILLLLWSVTYVTDGIDRFVSAVIFLCIIAEPIGRFFFSDGSDSPILPKPLYGPPNSKLKSERKEFSLDTRRGAASNRHKALNLYKKAVSFTYGFGPVLSRTSDEFELVETGRDKQPSYLPVREII